MFEPLVRRMNNFALILDGIGSMLPGIINSAPNFVIDMMKPFVLKEAYVKMRTDIDSKLDELLKGYTLPNSIQPLDLVIAEARAKVRDFGYDPWIVGDHNRTVGMFSVKLANTWISGASSFYRHGDIVVRVDNNTLTIGKP